MMPPKKKSKKNVTPQTPTKKGKQINRRKQQLPPDLTLTDTEVQGLDDDEQPSLKSMMTLLVDMNAQLATNEKNVESLAAEKEARLQSLSTVPDEPSTSRGATSRGVTTSPHLPDHETFQKITDEVGQAKEDESMESLGMAQGSAHPQSHIRHFSLPSSEPAAVPSNFREGAERAQLLQSAIQAWGQNVLGFQP